MNGRLDKLLKLTFAEFSRGQVVGPVAEKVRLGSTVELARALTDDYQSPEDPTMVEALIADWKLKQNRSLRSVVLSCQHLITFFKENPRAKQITGDRITQFILARLQGKIGKKPAANASVNRELAALRRAFNLMVQAQAIEPRRCAILPASSRSRTPTGFP
jgi:hypothetical protein